MRYRDTYTVSLQYQGREVDGSDVDRAKGALLDRLESLGVPPDRACSAYEVQWAAYDDEGPMTGDARAYIEARSAADVALTSTWADAGTDRAWVDGFSV